VKLPSEKEVYVPSWFVGVPYNAVILITVAFIPHHSDARFPGVTAQ
jgi:hypothetical protein